MSSRGTSRLSNCKVFPGLRIVSVTVKVSVCLSGEVLAVKGLQCKLVLVDPAHLEVLPALCCVPVPLQTVVLLSWDIQVFKLRS